MNAIELIRAKKVHLARLANQKGAAGEALAVGRFETWASRPRGAELNVLLDELAATGVVIRRSSFDAIAMPTAVDLSDRGSVRSALSSMTFIEIKTSNQGRVKPGFEGFFFALTEHEITAAEQLGSRHKVALFNRVTGELLLTSVQQILARSKSMTWQVSVQL